MSGEERRGEEKQGGEERVGQEGRGEERRRKEERSGTPKVGSRRGGHRNERERDASVATTQERMDAHTRSMPWTMVENSVTESRTKSCTDKDDIGTARPSKINAAQDRTTAHHIALHLISAF